MMQVVDTYFKAILFQPRDKLGGRTVVAFGDKVETGPESELHLQLGKRFDTIKSSFPFDIVCQHHGKLSARRPAGPAFRRTL